ncbi:hypothetical protein CNYM01_03276 [Colletotrichum nymphaeae SA-01]|uniref:Uncharacterized protein n=1 Tax=Colletotrichum nymphaeae SA-01 TaxID=1460502 RepID=A0A135SXE8_9PEZI|nr:hypothetical protein CNYM01_03276 [Colletotrichum nymphaeae SA-01]
MVSRARSITLPPPAPENGVAQQLMVAGVEESDRIRRGCCEGERKICFKANMEVHDLARAQLVTWHFATLGMRINDPVSTNRAISAATRSHTLACGRVGGRQQRGRNSFS